MTGYSTATATAWRRTARPAGALIVAIALASTVMGLILGITGQTLILAAGMIALQIVIPEYAARQAEVTQLSEPPQTRSGSRFPLLLGWKQPRYYW